MSNLGLVIGGRRFAVACAPGEEAHVTALGRMIDAKVAAMGDAGRANEARMLLFGALLLADELHEARMAGALSAGALSSPAAAASMPEAMTRIAETLENLADRLEALASSL